MKGNSGEMNRSLLVLAYLAAKDVIRKVPLAFLLLLCLIMGGSLLLPSGMALAQAPAMEAANRGLQDVSEESARPTSVGILTNGEFPQSLEDIAETLHQPALGNGLYNYCEAAAVTPQGPAPEEVQTLQPGPDAGKEAEVYNYTYRNWENANWGGNGSISAGYVGYHSGMHCVKRGYIEFDLPSLPSGLEIVTAKLGLYGSSDAKCFDVDPADFALYRVTGPWVEGQGIYHPGEVEATAPEPWITWHRQPTFDSTKAYGMTGIARGHSGWVDFDITELVKGWYKGTWPNYGMVLRAVEEGAACKVMNFSSSDTVTPEQRPKLVITFSTEGATPLAPTPVETPTPHASPTVAWASVCAVAKPSISGGSLFTVGKFTITGDEPQTIRVTTGPAENFAIVRTDVGRKIVYQNIDFQSYGSLTLKPGTYELSCTGRGAIGLMSNKVCIQYPVAQEAPPATTEPKSGVVLPPREVVVATLPDGSKLIAVPGPGAFNWSLIPGEIRLEVGQTTTMRLEAQRPDGSSEPAWWQSADPGDLAMVERAGVEDGQGVSRVTGGWAGKGWLRGSGGFRTRLIVSEAVPDPTEAWQKGKKATIELWVTRGGSPVKGASIHLNHQDYVSGSPSGKSFDDPKWKTDDQGYCKIETTGLFAGRYKVRVVKMAEADKGENFGSNMWSKKEPPFTLAPGQIAEFAFEIEMQTMREKYPGMALP